MRKNKRAREWWTRLSPEKRAEMQARQIADGARPREMARDPHSHSEDIACIACGTDGMVGCLVPR